MTSSLARVLAPTIALLLTVGLTACSDDDGGEDTSSNSTTAASTADCALVPEDAAWYGDNLDRLNEMITDLGDCDRSPDADGAPLALFDWDNTVVKNDIGDAQTFWMLANGKVKQPADKDWSTVSPFLTTEATTALADACADLAEAGEPLPTDTGEGVDCADEIVEVYSEAATTDGEDAFADFNARRMEPAYAFAAQLLAGYTTEEITDFADQAREQNTSAEEGTEQTIGTHEVTGWVHYYDQVSDLITALRGHGFDVRIISASAEPVAEAWGAELGFTPEQVMGVMTEPDGESWSSSLVSCGYDETSIPYIEGKRCRVNEEVYGITGASAFEPAPEDTRQVFGAGDSDTDVTFMSDATALRLAINRNKTELMCSAYYDEDGKWLVNPMFIDPKEQQEDAYPCATAGRITPDDSTEPLKDAAGETVPDQEDSVF